MACLGPSTLVINQYMGMFQRRPRVDRGRWVTSDSSYPHCMPRTIDPCHKSIHGHTLVSTLARYRMMGHLGLVIFQRHASNWLCLYINTRPGHIPPSTLGRHRTVGHLGHAIFYWHPLNWAWSHISTWPGTHKRQAWLTQDSWPLTMFLFVMLLGPMNAMSIWHVRGNPPSYVGPGSTPVGALVMYS
jgi:hypothetical protein